MDKRTRVVNVVSASLMLAVVLCILWLLGLLPTLIEGILFPFRN